MRRWTIKDLHNQSDRELIKGFLVDRREKCTNVYAPLYQKLSQIITNLEGDQTFDANGNLYKQESRPIGKFRSEEVNHYA